MNFLYKTTQFLRVASITVAALFIAPQVFAQNDPPGRVARVSYAYGNLSFADAGSSQWVDLQPNRPISTGDSVYVPELGRAELHVGANALRLNEKTKIAFINLTDDSTQVQLTQGNMVVRVRALYSKEIFQISTPNLSFTVQEPGEYRINVNEDNTSTIIVRHGIGVAQGERDVITLREGEQSRFSGTNLNHTQITYAPPPDTFDQWAIDRDRAEDNSVSARYVSREVIGYQQLDDYGSWETSGTYGAIWYPRSITVGWAPYRDGSWVWVAPWGWTWVDRSPWGFAPYHYGRWAYVGHRWGWVPGPYEPHYRPVYAPALVAFVGAGSNGLHGGVGISMSASVSWFPLGPGEIYRPSYSQNPRYIQSINHAYINNTTVINNVNVTKNVYVNQRVTNAVTSVSTQTFVHGDHVFPASKPILASQLKQMQVITEAPAIAPEKSNRFGDARPRNWQENDQYRSRPVISAPNSPPSATQNNAPNANRTVNPPIIGQNPSPQTTQVAPNMPSTHQIEMRDRVSNSNGNRPPVNLPTADVRNTNQAAPPVPQNTPPLPINEQHMPQNERPVERRFDRAAMPERPIERPAPVQREVPQPVPVMPRVEPRPPQAEPHRENRTEKEKEKEDSKNKAKNEKER